MSTLTKDLQGHWANIRPIFTIRNEHEYDSAMKRLNELLDAISDNERHPLYGLLDTLGALVHVYEGTHHPMPECTGADMLRFCMEEHSLHQSDLSEIGSQGVVSEILNGKRELNIRQVRLLAKRFQVSAAVFI